MNILAIDPGKTTGIVVCQTAKEMIDGKLPFGVMIAEDLLWEDRFLLREYIRTSDIVICESFNLYPGAAQGQAHIRSDFPSIQVIGLIQAYMYELNKGEPIMQMPSMRKRSLILPEHQAALKGLKHARDAYKHARYYIVRNKEELADGT